MLSCKKPLISTVVDSHDVMQVTVFSVNYRGRPFMQSLSENSFFMTCLMIFAVGSFFVEIGGR